MEPFNLPKGSIRGIVIIGLCGIFCLLLIKDKPVPDALGLLLASVVGYYFGRGKFFSESPEAKPLHLPAGGIRALIVVMLLATAIYLGIGNRLGQDSLVVDLFALVVGFAGGNLIRFTKSKRGSESSSTISEYIGHLRGLFILIVMAFLLGYVATDYYTSLYWGWRVFILSAVAFYFGIRD